MWTLTPCQQQQNDPRSSPAIVSSRYIAPGCVANRGMTLWHPNSGSPTVGFGNEFSTTIDVDENGPSCPHTTMPRVESADLIAPVQIDLDAGVAATIGRRVPDRVAVLEELDLAARHEPTDVDALAAPADLERQTRGRGGRQADVFDDDDRGGTARPRCVGLRREHLGVAGEARHRDRAGRRRRDERRVHTVDRERHLRSRAQPSEEHMRPASSEALVHGRRQQRHRPVFHREGRGIIPVVMAALSDPR